MALAAAPSEAQAPARPDPSGAAPSDAFPTAAQPQTSPSLALRGRQEADTPAATTSATSTLAPAADAGLLAGPPPLTPTNLPRVVGLPAGGDPAPLCRSQCAAALYACRSGDGDTCDAEWTTCRAACTAAR